MHPLSLTPYFRFILGTIFCFPICAQDLPETSTETLSLDSLGEGSTSDTEDPVFGSFGDNLRWAVDLSARGIYNQRRDAWDHAFFVGIDLHKVFTGDQGDWGTLLLQPYLTRIDSPAHPAFFEDDHDLELVYRIFNFNYTGLARGKFNLKLGHFEVPFGLEHYINTNGTLRDYTHGRNIGVKADWGLSLNGELETFDYEVSATRGTGNEWSSRGDPYLYAGRVSTPGEDDLILGASLLYGEVQKTALPGNTLFRRRVGIDASLTTPVLTFLAEMSAGRDEKTDVINGILEVDWYSRNESLLIYDQVFFFNSDLPSGWESAIANALGVRWNLNGKTSLSCQWKQDLSVFAGAKTAGVFALQLRYRF